MALGSASYFGLPREPVLAVAAVAGLSAAVLVAARGWGRPSRARAAALTLVAFALLGFAAARLRTELVRTPIIPPGSGVSAVTAWVVDVASPGQGGERVVLAPVRVAGLAPEETPVRLRVTLGTEDPIPAPGTLVRFRAVLNPPPPPASPGAYDFARDAFFQGLGGAGFAVTPMAPLVSTEEPPLRLRAMMGINAARWRLALHIVNRLGPQTGGLAAAMVTGQEAFVPKAEVDDLRAAGLAHIISISGLHMAIVGGAVFAAVRLLAAAIPFASLRVSGKKVAAGAGLIAVLGYLVLSGAPSPAIRAAVTASMAFVAILADRRALSLHTLALSALGILALQPEAVTEPGFQMSYAATTALVALAEAWPRPLREVQVPLWIRGLQGAVEAARVALAASLVAGLATGPIAQQHFNRVSAYGLVGNLAAEPISSLVLMPALALGTALSPAGADGPAIGAAGWAIDVMLRLAHGIAQWPGAQRTVAAAPDWTLPVAILGILWICLWRGRLRWAGLPAALAVSLAPRPPLPDAWIAADASTVAVRAGADAVLFRPDARRFAAELWSRRRGLEVAASGRGRLDSLYACDRWTCRPRTGAPSLGAIWNRRPAVVAKAWPGLCSGAEVIVVRGPAAPPSCPGALVIGQDQVARGGSAELYRTGEGGWRIAWAQPLRGDRPWTAYAGGETGRP